MPKSQGKTINHDVTKNVCIFYYEHPHHKNKPKKIFFYQPVKKNDQIKKLDFL